MCLVSLITCVGLITWVSADRRLVSLISAFVSLITSSECSMRLVSLIMRLAD
jgi:hypothetical protein